MACCVCHTDPGEGFCACDCSEKAEKIKKLNVATVDNSTQGKEMEEKGSNEGGGGVVAAVIVIALLLIVGSFALIQSHYKDKESA